MKNKPVYLLSIFYLILISVLFLFFRAPEKQMDELKEKKRDNRIAFFKEQGDKNPGFVKRFRYRKRVQRETDSAFNLFRGESERLFGQEFTRRIFREHEDSLRNIIFQGNIAGARETVYEKYEQYIAEETGKTPPVVAHTPVEDRTVPDRVPQLSSGYVPVPDAQTRYQFMTIALANYLMFSNDIEGYFRKRTELLNSMTAPEDRLYFAEKTALTILEFYLREETINRTAIISAVHAFEREIRDARVNINDYYGYLSSYYYFGGDIRKALEYGRKGLEYSKDIIRSRGIDPDKNETIFILRYDHIRYELASGNHQQAYALLKQCLKFINVNYSGQVKQNQIWHNYGNIFNVETISGKPFPHKDFFLGVLMAGYQNELALVHLNNYIASGEPEFLSEARTIRAGIGGIK